MLVFALALLLGVNKMASASSVEPTCESGYHYVGNYSETQVCHNVCTKYFLSWCIKWQNQCETVGSWSGSCVANEVTPDPITPDPIAPAPVKMSSGDGLVGLLNSYCKQEMVEYSPWSECNYMFNKQFRVLFRDAYGRAANGCIPTASQQISQMKDCE